MLCYRVAVRSGKWFQSAPGREAGRCGIYPRRGLQPRRFNPRPAVRPGDAPATIDEMIRMSVSIRARP